MPYKTHNPQTETAFLSRKQCFEWLLNSRGNSMDSRRNSTDSRRNSTDSLGNSTGSRRNSTDSLGNSTGSRRNSTDSRRNSTDSLGNSTDSRRNSTDYGKPSKFIISGNSTNSECMNNQCSMFISQVQCKSVLLDYSSLRIGYLPAQAGWKFFGVRLSGKNRCWRSLSMNYAALVLIEQKKSFEPSAIFSRSVQEQKSYNNINH